MRSPFASALVLAVATLAVACGGTSAPEIPIDNAEPELASSAKGIVAGDFATTERAGGQLDPFGCRHYQMLHLKGLDATLESKLDSADPSFMDSDGSCGGEEIPKGSSTKYPVRFVEKSGCGAAVFEGTMEQMYNSAAQLLKYPDDTLIYCGHEYTLNNVKWALHVDPDNVDVQQRVALEATPPTVPLQLGVEKRTNHFLRCDDPKIQAFTGKTEPAEVFGALRTHKNNFK